MPLPSNDAKPGSRGCGRAVIGRVVVLAALCAAPVAARATPAAAPSVVQPDPTPLAPPRAAAPFRIVAIGSSSTQGIGASSAAAAYPAQLQRMFDGAFHATPPVAVINRGIGGEDIDDMVKRLGTDVIARKPDLVIWQVGSNDSLRGVPLERFEAELRSGIAAIRAAGAEVELMEPQWSPRLEKADASSRFVEAVRQVGDEQHVAVVRRFEMMRHWVADGSASQQELIGPDGLHMTDRGYAMLAKAVFDQIARRSSAFHARIAVAAAPRL